jgi:uncharacterized protein (TIGR03437 family)
MRILSLFLGIGMLAGGGRAASFRNVSAASGGAMVAPDSIVAAMGSDLATQQVRTAGVPLLTSLGNISVQVVDSAGVARLAGLYFVSPEQINYVIPAGTAPGMATVNILNDAMPTGMSAPAQVEAVAPALYSANGDGKGVAAASAVRIVIPTNIQSSVAVYQCGDQAGSCAGVPIDPGLDAPVYLSFYGSGIRDAKKVTVTIGGMDVPVLYAGPQPAYPGLDQINVPLVLALRGKGLVDVVVTADGVASNAVQINVR